MVHVKIGPDRHTLASYVPNRDDKPFRVDSANFTGDVLVRIAKYHGQAVTDAPHGSPYFKSRQRKYSITFTGRFKPTNRGAADGKWTANDVFCWIEMEKPLRLPPRIVTAAGLAFIHVFDPTFITEVS